MNGMIKLAFMNLVVFLKRRFILVTQAAINLRLLSQAPLLILLLDLASFINNSISFFWSLKYLIHVLKIILYLDIIFGCPYFFRLAFPAHIFQLKQGFVFMGFLLKFVNFFASIGFFE